MKSEFELMMKCDMCYDRTSEGKRPMCATVCPSQALFFGTAEQIEALRPRSSAVNEFHFGREVVRTRVFMMVPKESAVEHLDVTAAMDAAPGPRRIKLDVVDAPASANEPDLLMESMFQSPAAAGVSQ
jgi:Fe-S-cluster-containing dehydrogenase component